MALKLYSLDISWAGGIVVIASSPEEAADILLAEHKDHMDYLVEGARSKETLVKDLSEDSLTSGLSIAFWGDI